MAKYEILTIESYGNRCWKPPVSMKPHGGTHAVPITLAELPKIGAETPIALMISDNQFIVVAMLGLMPGRNSFVSPIGEWLGSYIPANLRKFPFALVAGTDGQLHLAFDTESKSLCEEGEIGEPFFDQAKIAATKTRQMFEFLLALAKDEQQTEQACKALQKYDLITPWSITVNTPTGKQAIDGLHHIDEQQLNALSADSLKELQTSGALMLAYCQLISEQQLPVLAKRMDVLAAQQPVVVPGGDLLSSLSSNGTLTLSGL